MLAALQKHEDVVDLLLGSGAEVNHETEAGWSALRWSWPALGFVLFRVLDVLKPWPANFIDRAVTGGFGVMLDDVVAGGYAGVASWLLVSWLP